MNLHPPPAVCLSHLKAEIICFTAKRLSLVAQLVKNPPAIRESWVRSLGLEDPLEKGKATYSSILAWRSHGLFSPWGRKELDTAELPSLTHSKKKSGLFPRILRGDLKALGMFCPVKACVYLEGLGSH